MDPKCLFKIAVTSFYFILFKQHYMFLYITILFEMYDLHDFQDNLELQSTLSLANLFIFSKLDGIY